MSDAKNTRVVVIKNGVAKELHNLPGNIMLELSQAYDKEPICGLSRDTYAELVRFFGNKLVTYQENLETGDAEGFEMYAKTVAFANAFDISSEESPVFFDMMLMIERCVAEQKNFNSKSINMRNLKAMTKMNWKETNNDFRNWARRLFEETGMRIGIVRMSKFFYGVITQLQTA